MSSQSHSTTALPSSDSPQPTNNEDASQTTTKTSEQDQQPNPTTENPRLASLQDRKATLEQTLHDLKAQRHQRATQTKLPSGLPLPTTTPSGEALSEDEILAAALKSSNAVIKDHISLLHKYNEIKDVGQGLMGLIADKRDVRVVKVMEEFGIAEGD